MQVIKQAPKEISRMVSFLKNGGVVICPTDTVYGFLADASNKKAVAKIYTIKKRLTSKVLPVFVADIVMAKKLAEVDVFEEKILKKYWPGKYTFVLKRKAALKLYGVDSKTIALRLPKYPFLNQLLKKIDRPLVQTSVNISNQPVLSKIGDIIEQFHSQDIILIDAGNLGKSKSSQILDLSGDKIKILRK